MDAVSSRLLAGLATQAPGLLAGGGNEGIAFLHVDDAIREVHGRGLNFQVAALSTPLASPVIAGAWLRRGSTASGRGSGRLLAPKPSRPAVGPE
ncbi:hypothetical protein [Nocardioides sp. InS609-2]|uniref:hypothetical protein n=1 Tax=Nocardioides sp. InS609-2 TaxID=2760705 RepID=UPI0020C01F2F|nr:hypothetical protein [Nocardioides sp. InS609-2]